MLSCLLMLLILSLPAQIAVAAKPHPSSSPVDKTVSKPAQGLFNAAVKHIIHAELLTKPRQQKPASRRTDLPEGLDKQLTRGHSLPPGWQRKVTPGKRLDYHLYRQAEPMPGELLRRLPSSPAGTTVIRIGDAVLRLDAATREVLAMFDLHRR